MSSDAISPYTERPIRPLPKRKLRERLSPDVADSIMYPPTPKAMPPLFYHQYNNPRDDHEVVAAESQHPSERERADEIERNYISRRNGDEVDSDEDEAAYRSRIYSRHSDVTGRSYRYVQKVDHQHNNPQPPASATSSVDGYDSFENTNNKKKRKIPTPGDSSLNGVHHSGDLNTMGASGTDLEESSNGNGSYPANGSVVGQGISGPGRGRYGRIRNGRSPLRTLSDSSGNWGNGRATKSRHQWPTPSESPGIISRSIANANADMSPITPARGQENFSLLQQQASKKPNPSAQFTFTFNSQVPSTIPWGGPNSNPNMHQNPSVARVTSHSTQTSPAVSGRIKNTPAQASQAKQGPPHHNTQKQAPAPGAPPKKTRRQTAREYIMAAKARRQQQEFKNYHHPPAAEDIWICEFCEYERIFGTPPEALIRQYEMKDRRIKKQEAERRRLLEKAKMKGRKGKKGNKAASKQAPATFDRQTQHQPAQQPAPMNQSHSQGTQSEEYYDDEYDEEYAHDDPPPSSPVARPTARRSEPLHPDPGRDHVAQPGGRVDDRVATAT